MDDADDDAETDGDEMNAAACGCSWGCSVNPIVDEAAAAAAAEATMVVLLSTDTVAIVSAMALNIFDVARIIFDPLILFMLRLNIFPMAILSVRNPSRKKIGRKREREKKQQL